MAKLGARHDELTASAAGHWFHAAEYRSGSIIDDRPHSPDMAKRDLWARQPTKDRTAPSIPRSCERAPRHFRAAAPVAA
jgi:hypothetical protein